MEVFRSSHLHSSVHVVQRILGTAGDNENNCFCTTSYCYGRFAFATSGDYVRCGYILSCVCELSQLGLHSLHILQYFEDYVNASLSRHVSSTCEGATAMLDGSFGPRSELTDSLCDLVNVLRSVMNRLCASLFITI